MSLKADLRASPEEFAGIIFLAWDIRVVQLHGSRASVFGRQVCYLSCAKSTHLPCVWLQVFLNSLSSIACQVLASLQKQPSQGAIVVRLVKICNKLLLWLLEENLTFQDSQTGFYTSHWEMWCRQQKAEGNCWSLPKTINDNKQKATPKRCSQGSSSLAWFQIGIFLLVEFSWCA